MLQKKQRPQALPGKTYKMRTACGPLYLTVTLDPQSGQPFEVFCRFAKSGTCAAAIMDVTTRLISHSLRYGIGTEEIIKDLTGGQCQHGGNTCFTAVGAALQLFLEEYGLEGR